MARREILDSIKFIIYTYDELIRFERWYNDNKSTIFDEPNTKQCTDYLEHYLKHNTHIPVCIELTKVGTIFHQNNVQSSYIYLLLNETIAYQDYTHITVEKVIDGKFNKSFKQRKKGKRS